MLAMKGFAMTTNLVKRGIAFASMVLFRSLHFSKAMAMQSSSWVPADFRRRLLQESLSRCADTARISGGVHFGSNKVILEDECFINTNRFIDGADWVYIGKRVHLAPNVSILTSTHELGEPLCRAGKDRTDPVHIGDGCWIAAGAIILPGVTVAPGCIVAAGAVLAKSTTANGLYAGVPAVRKRDL